MPPRITPHSDNGADHWLPSDRPGVRPLPEALVRLVETGVPNRAALSHADARTAEQRILRRVAASAQAHGWDLREYCRFILDNERSRIGEQIRFPTDTKRQTHETNVVRRLRRVWDSASEYRASSSGWDRDRAALSVSSMARKAAADPSTMLTADMRVTLVVFALLSEKHRHSHVPLNRRAVVEHGGLSEYKAREAIKRLEERGWLVCVDRGRSGSRDQRLSAKFVPGPALTGYAEALW